MSSDAAVRSALRETVKRLQKIRQRCGVGDEADGPTTVSSSGDPFKDHLVQFMETVKDVKAQIETRNEEAKTHGQDAHTIEDSHAIRKKLRRLEGIVSAMQKLTTDAEAQLATAERKKKGPEKVGLLRQQLTDRRAMVAQCEGTVEAVHALDQQRHGGGSTEAAGDKTLALLGGAAKQAKRKLQLREQLTARKFAHGGGAPAAAAHEGVVDWGAGVGGRLEEDPETAEQMKVLSEQEKKIDAGLSRVGEGVRRLEELARAMGTELETQAKLIDNTDDRIDKDTEKLIALNRRLTKTIKGVSPMSMCINIACLVLLLGLTGYILFLFEVI